MNNFRKGKQLIGYVEFITCPYCQELHGKNKKILDGKHLKKHGKSIDMVMIEHPNHVTMIIEQYQSRINQGNNLKNKIKKVKCYYHKDSDCPGDEIEVPGTSPNYIFCETCKNIGKENPDGRTKNTANLERSKTLQKKYGVDNAANVPGVSEKKAKTNEERYGGFGFASEELAKKTRDVIQEKYGKSNIMKTEEGKDCFANYFKSMYGETITNPLHVFEIKNRMMKTAASYYKNNDHPTKGKTYEEMYGIEKAKELREQRRIDGAKGYLKAIENGYQGPSKPQIELFNLVKEIFPSAILDQENNSYVLDIAIPEYRLAIEYDGSYWHNDERDKIRDLVLESVGWKTLRFKDYIPTKEELIQKIEEIL